MEKLLNYWLFSAAILTFLVALLHLVIIFSGPDWYRFFGAGERMAKMAEQGHWYPTAITFFIACVLFVWGLYALAGAGLIERLPLVNLALAIITGVFLLRGAALLDQFRFIPDLSDSFWIWSSAISLILGIVYLVGFIQHLTSSK